MTAKFAEAIISVEAGKTVPWGPHFGLIITFKNNVRSIKATEIVRPRPIDQAVEQLKKVGQADE